jgi:hypothetical protein
MVFGLGNWSEFILLSRGELLSGILLPGSRRTRANFDSCCFACAVRAQRAKTLSPVDAQIQGINPRLEKFSGEIFDLGWSAWRAGPNPPSRSPLKRPTQAVGLQNVIIL